MSIFVPEAPAKNSQACAACGEAVASDKKLCLDCIGLFTTQGEPFIIHCDTYRLERKENDRIEALVLWVMDHPSAGRIVVRELGRVKRITPWHPADDALEYLMDELNYELTYKTEAAWRK